MKIRWKAILLGAAVLLLLAQGALAMSSPGYRLEWFPPLTGGGGTAQSANYSIQFTVGQTVDTASASPLYQAQMGYWAGIAPEYRVMMPAIYKSP
jgi:hypothetical protein